MFAASHAEVYSSSSSTALQESRYTCTVLSRVGRGSEGRSFSQENVGGLVVIFLGFFYRDVDMTNKNKFTDNLRTIILIFN